MCWMLCTLIDLSDSTLNTVKWASPWRAEIKRAYIYKSGTVRGKQFSLRSFFSPGESIEHRRGKAEEDRATELKRRRLDEDRRRWPSQLPRSDRLSDRGRAPVAEENCNREKMRRDEMDSDKAPTKTIRWRPQMMTELATEIGSTEWQR